MQTVDKIFTFEERNACAPFVDRIRRTWSQPFDRFVSAAQPQWELVITRQQGRAWVVIRGPQTLANVSGIPQDAEFVGARFELGSFMTALPPNQMVDKVITLPNVGDRSFWLDGAAWETPNYDNIDVFLERLARRGLLARDRIVEDAAHDVRQRASARTVQRRIRRATGLTQGMIRQIERAGRAAALLAQGIAVPTVVERAGYADHAHLTRSLKRFVGQTPSVLGRP
jgi:hypothetical protein